MNESSLVFQSSLQQSKVPDFATLFALADEQGKAAAAACKPRGMVVSWQSNGVPQQEYVADGVCGFAWVTVKPGNCKFAKWLKATGKGRKGWEGGIVYWVSDYNQSMQKKAAYASAFAGVLSAYGVTAYAGSRMD